MKTRKFYTIYDRPEKSPEINSGEILVEKAGYEPAKNKIERMIIAGRRLQDFRRHQFDFQPGEEIDETFIDPTRNPAFDPSDAFQMGERARAGIHASKKVAGDSKSRKEASAADAKVEKSEEPGE